MKSYYEATVSPSFAISVTSERPALQSQCSIDTKAKNLQESIDEKFRRNRMGRELKPS